jgi:release factor glutamine methyltransferase
LPRAGRLSGDARNPTISRAEALASLTEAFARAGVEEPSREARLALRQAAGVSAAALIAAPEAALPPDAAQRLAEVVRRRAAGEPLSRIAGRRAFWSLDFLISLDVLDPRPDTETIVEAALALFAARRDAPIRILDLGVGSGAILCALLTEFRAASGVGVDVSRAAAAVARRNVEALRLSARAEIRVGDWTDGLSGRFDLIVSNPPYIPTGDIAGLSREVAAFDPRLALDGGADGLDPYRAIVPAAARRIAPGGALIVEVGAGQAAEVSAMAARAGFTPTVRRDLAGVERVVVARAAAGGALQGEGGVDD